MALISTNVSENSGNIPLTAAKLRVLTEPKLNVAKNSGGKSWHVEFEIAEPSEVTDVDGNAIAIAGRKLSRYLPIEGKGISQFQQFHKALRDAGNDVPVDIELDDETGLATHGIPYTGLTFWATVATRVQKPAPGVQPIMNPLTGKPLEDARLELTKFIINA